MRGVDEYLEDFEAFCNVGLKRTLRPYQMAPARSIIRSVVAQEGRTIAILMARQAGKNELLACVAVWMLLRLSGIKIGIYAPTLPQAVDISMRRIKRHLRRLGSRMAREATGDGRRETADGRPRRGTRRLASGPPSSAASGAGVLRLPMGPLLVSQPVVDRQDLLELPQPEGCSEPFAGREEGSLLGAHSGEPGAEKEGFTWDVILYDEAQDIDRDVIDEEIAPAGAATSATEVFIGTPYRVDCKFYDIIQAVKEGRLAGESFEYSHEVVARHVPEYARFVEKKAAELGRESIAFRTQYGLEWVHGLGMFFDFEVFRTLAMEGEEFVSCQPRGQSVGVWECGGAGEQAADARSVGVRECGSAGDGPQPQGPSPERQPPGPHTPIPPHPHTLSFAVGIDLAGDDPGRTGRTDFTAIAVLRRDGQVKTLVDLHAWQGKDWERQFSDIARILRGLPGRAQVAVDATGMGDPFSDRLQKELAGRPIAVERLRLTAASKSDVGLYAEQEVAGERVFYAAGPATRASGRLDEFLHQVRWLAREHLPDKAVRWYVSPDKGHDDMVCAFFLALWAARRSPVVRLPLGDLATADGADFR